MKKWGGREKREIHIKNVCMWVCVCIYQNRIKELALLLDCLLRYVMRELVLGELRSTTFLSL